MQQPCTRKSPGGSGFTIPSIWPRCMHRKQIALKLLRLCCAYPRQGTRIQHLTQQKKACSFEQI